MLADRTGGMSEPTPTTPQTPEARLRRPPRIVLDYPVFDTAQPARDARFWADLLHGVVSRDEPDWHEVTYGNGERLCFQLAHTHASPDWPHGQQQLHLDFVVDPDAVSAAHRHALAVGARLLHPHDESEIGAAESGFIAYADPSGHPFCLCWRQ